MWWAERANQALKRTRRGAWAGTAMLALPALWLLALAATACIVEPTELDAAANPDAVVSAVPLPTIAAPSFEPTVEPESIEPTPTEVPEPTQVAPTPTPEPTPAAPAIETQVPELDSVPVPVSAGLIGIPVHGVTTFRLSEERPILQLPGHALIYLDADRQAEVDIFTPIATGDDRRLTSTEDVVIALTTSPAFVDLTELTPVSINGVPTRVFEGRPIPGERMFWVDESTLGDAAAGWFPPARLRMWLIDGPRGPVFVTAESLTDPGQYADAVRLAADILSTLTLG